MNERRRFDALVDERCTCWSSNGDGNVSKLKKRTWSKERFAIILN